uniref:Palmitoyltransferase n=1 Tax=Steinernema glaseri TaxID=37863 RepID=A0A1I7YUK5_9BILA
MLQLLYADEKVPNRFKCCYKRFHVVPMSKMIAVFHGLVFTSALFWYLPQSIYLFPIVPLVFVTAFHGFRSENPAPLIALQLYLTFLVLINVLFAISIFAVSMVDYERLLVFIGHDCQGERNICRPCKFPRCSCHANECCVVYPKLIHPARYADTLLLTRTACCIERSQRKKVQIT